MSESWRKLLLEAFIILLLGMLVGLSLNYRMLLAILEGAPPPVVPAVAPATTEVLPEPVGRAELRELLAAGALPVDARAPELYAEGHLPGAFSLPLAEAQQGPAALAGRLPAGRVLVTYCSGYACSDSFDLARLLLQAGHREVRVYEGGFPEWRDAGLPVARGAH